MRGNSSPGHLAPLDLEIEATCRKNNTKRRRKYLQERIVQPSAERTCSSESSSTFPVDLRESEVGASEANIMADEQTQRLLLRTTLALPCRNFSQVLHGWKSKHTTLHILIP